MKRRIAWSAKASADYHQQLGFIAEQDASNADLVDQRLMSAIEILAEVPNGRVGRVTGTYEKLVAKTSLIIVYQVTDETLLVIRIIHSKRNWQKDQWPQEP